MSSGGGPTSTQVNTIPEWLQSYGQGYLGRASDVSQQPYTPYTGQRVADLSPLQQSSIQGLGNLAGGTDSMRAADSMLTGTLQGRYQNPFAGNGGANPGGTYNFNPTGVGSNPYIGENPYFHSSLQTGLGDIARAYQQGTSADTTRLMNQSGVLGGGANQRAVANNERDLADRMGNFTNNMMQGQFDRSANLEEAGLSRGLNAQQFNANLGNQSFENSANRNLNASQFNSNRDTQAWENERQRQMGAAGAATGLGSGMSQSYLNALQGGDLERQNMQSLLNSQYTDFTDWRGYPEHQLGVFGNALGSLLGRAGGTQTTQGPGSDPFAQGLGLMMLGNNANKGGGGGGVTG